MKAAILSVLVALLGFGLVACGSGDDSATTGADRETTAAEAPANGEEATGDGQRKSGKSKDGGSAENGPGSAQDGDDADSAEAGGAEGDNRSGGDGAGNGGDGPGTARSNKEAAAPLEQATKKESDEISGFGDGAALSDQESAQAVLSIYARSYDEEDWATTCGTLSKALSKAMIGLAKSNPEVKGDTCVAVFEYAGKQGLAPNLGTALSKPIDSFRVEGTKGWAIYGGGEYAMPMVREGSDWKLEAFEPKQLS